MKKRIGVIGIFIIMIVVLLTIFFGVKAAMSMKRNNIPYELIYIEKNEEREIYDENDVVLNMTYLDSETIENAEDVQLNYTVKLVPVSEFEMKDTYIKLRSDYGKKPHGDNINFYDTNVELNTSINSIDIFSQKITEETIYTFTFIIPLTLNEASYKEGEIYVYIFNQYMF